ncbi:MAG TPA: hypothetical protein VEE82_03640 [Thermodesulfovibrionales bacterium]|nr:hypothetical protein [Thermodesulfovibrionales bacterium]
MSSFTIFFPLARYSLEEQKSAEAVTPEKGLNRYSSQWTTQSSERSLVKYWSVQDIKSSRQWINEDAICEFIKHRETVPEARHFLAKAISPAKFSETVRELLNN